MKTPDVLGRGQDHVRRQDQRQEFSGIFLSRRSLSLESRNPTGKKASEMNLKVGVVSCRLSPNLNMILFPNALS